MRYIIEAALKPGVKIGPKGDSVSLTFGWLTSLTTPTGRIRFGGPWANDGNGVKNRYLGLKFAIKGKTHYGWARLNVSMTGPLQVNITATLTGYAYETIPNKPIITGKTHGRMSLRCDLRASVIWRVGLQRFRLGAGKNRSEP